MQVVHFEDNSIVHKKKGVSFRVTRGAKITFLARMKRGNNNRFYRFFVNDKTIIFKN